MNLDRLYHQHAGFVPLLSLVILLLAAVTTRSQETPAPRRSLYGVGDGEFMIGAYMGTSPPPGQPIDSLWGFARSMGLNFMRVNLASPAQAGELANSPARDSLMLIAMTGLVNYAGWGREVEFYPFDSVQSAYWENRFTERDGGAQQYNTSEPGVPQERLYSLATTDPDQQIAGRIAYGWKPWQRSRYSSKSYDTNAQNVDAMLGTRLDFYPYNTHYVVVRGRLIDSALNPEIPDDSALLRVELWYEIPKGRSYVESDHPVTFFLDSARLATPRYLDSLRNAHLPNMVLFYSDTLSSAEREGLTGSLLEEYQESAGCNEEILYKTLYITKGSLRGIPGSGLYRDTSIAVDMARSPGSPPGPLFPGNESKRLDIRAYWLGGEQVALRSIALRDSIGELMLGRREGSIAFQREVRNEIRQTLRNPDSTLRDGIIALVSGNEPADLEYATWNAVDRLIKSDHNRGKNTGDSVGAFIEGVRYAWTGVVDNWHHLTEAGIVSIEIGMSNVPTKDSIFTESSSDPFGRAYPKLPSISEHNGGRFHIPTMEVSPEGIEAYEATLQNGFVGRYTPYAPAYSDYQLRWTTLLGQAARTARRTGRRMLSIPFTTVETSIDPYIQRVTVAGQSVDSIMFDVSLPHLPEPSELRLMVNLSLCYGANGIYYYWFGSTENEVYGTSVNGISTHRYYTDLGSNGPRTDDTIRDLEHQFVYSNPGIPERAVIPNFYIGFGARTAELRWLNGWLQRIGAEMMKLRWRDAYSIHFSQLDPMTFDRLEPYPRPLPSHEIVSEVKAYNPRTGQVDAPLRTYVELGLFDRKSSLLFPGNRLLDTHHIVVVNRRAFEIPDTLVKVDRDRLVDTLLIGGDRARAMRELTEARRIEIRFNLPSIDSGALRHNLIRVREIAPDTRPLPGEIAPRRGLDTVVHQDSIVMLMLRPGGGALLRITPHWGDSSPRLGGANRESRYRYAGRWRADNQFVGALSPHPLVGRWRAMPVRTKEGRGEPISVVSTQATLNHVVQVSRSSL